MVLDGEQRLAEHDEGRVPMAVVQSHCDLGEADRLLESAGVECPLAGGEYVRRGGLRSDRRDGADRMMCARRDGVDRTHRLAFEVLEELCVGRRLVVPTEVGEKDLADEGVHEPESAGTLRVDLDQTGLDSGGDGVIDGRSGDDAQPGEVERPSDDRCPGQDAHGVHAEPFDPATDDFSHSGRDAETALRRRRGAALALQQAEDLGDEERVAVRVIGDGGHGGSVERLPTESGGEVADLVVAEPSDRERGRVPCEGAERAIEGGPSFDFHVAVRTDDECSDVS